MTDGSNINRRHFVLDSFEPAYRSLTAGELSDRVKAGLHELEDCCACPRNCHVNRLANESKACYTGRHARVANAFAHHGEESCLRGRNGSGTIFFSLCNLRCVFCQNWDISQEQVGAECTADEIAMVMLSLQRRGCHNINFVTPEHVVPQVLEAVAVAVRNGLRIPIVYNTSAYDSVESLRLLEGIVDIYMPDFKFWKPETASRLAKARDYPERAREAIAEMHRQVGALKFSPDGLACRGVLVRHLVMPDQLEETAAIMCWLATELSPHTYVNIMAQYRPSYRVGEPTRSGHPKHPEIDRTPTSAEMTRARAAALEVGLWRLDERW
jgi:putative pyruvate formate lyase activating enzyme